MCRVFPGAGTPTHYLGFDQVYSDWICAEIDKGLAQFVRWYDSRMEATQKVGKGNWQRKYRTLEAVLGIKDEEERAEVVGGEAVEYTSEKYLLAVIEATKRGEPAPDIEEWILAQQAEAESRANDGLDRFRERETWD